MRVFAFDAAVARRHFEKHGWVHLTGAITQEFHQYAREFVRATLNEGPDRVGGNRQNKDQFRFDFPDPFALQEEAFPLMQALSGLSEDGFVLSERHVNAYREDAVPNPLPHKDRFASQLSVGIAIDVQPGSHLVLWPEHDRTVNRFNSAAELYASLPDERRPERVLAGIHPVEIYDRPGDVVAFAGSSIWHCRRQAAGTVNLFLKFNDFADDPLGEDARAAVGSSATGG